MKSFVRKVQEEKYLQKLLILAKEELTVPITNCIK